MADTFDRLKAALADRYAIERGREDHLHVALRQALGFAVILAAATACSGQGGSRSAGADADSTSSKETVSTDRSVRAKALGPKDVLEEYLAATLSGEMETAYEFMSAEDKAAKELDEYIAETKAWLPLIKAVGNQTTYEISDLRIVGPNAQAVVDVTGPDIATLFMDLMAVGFAAALGAVDEDSLQRSIARKYSTLEMPAATTTESYTLRQEQGRWKVLVGWHKKAVLSETKELRKQGRLRAALAKYDELLSSTPEDVDVIAERQETLEELRSVEKKRAYMEQIEIQDFRIGEGQKYSFGEPKPAAFGTIVNHGDRTLTEVKITVYFLDENGIPIAEEDFYPVLVTEFSVSAKPLRPSYVKDFGYVIDEAPSVWDGHSARVRITDIDFEKQ